MTITITVHNSLVLDRPSYENFPKTKKKKDSS